MCIAQRAQRAHRLLPAVLLLGLLVWGASGCGGEATSASGSAGGWGASDAVSGSDGGMVYDDASASDAGGSWGGGADTSAGGWGASDTSAAEDTSGPDEDDAGGQSWQQTSDSPPVAQVSLGGGNTLELVSMRVAVRVEGLRARVLVDHIFKNPHPKVIEGTFRYTLPPESSVSYFAMFEGQSGAQPAFFGSGDGLGGSDQATIAGTTPITVVTGADKKVWGTAKVAKIQRHIEAVQVYEKETEKKIDPALVEAVAPNTFSAKVYPIPANGHNRILIAWEQTLPSMPKAGGGRVYEYVFPVPKGDLESFDFTLLAKKAHITAGKLIGNTTGGVAAYKPGELPKDVTETTVTESATKAGYLARMVSGSDTGDGTLKGGKLAFHFDPALGS
ncbi:MAG: hypothetical protein KC502_22705, partial [Myxococcales bacterium]|nr:hypothetical protein [Myxococcales bacterium]